MKWKEKQDFSVIYRILVARAFTHLYFWFLTSNFTALGSPLRTPFCLLEVVVPRFLAAILKKFAYLSILDGETLVTWFAVCQGLLKTRRHIESREDPGNEVDVSFIDMLMKSLTFFGIGRSRTPLKTQVYRNNALASRHSFFLWGSTRTFEQFSFKAYIWIVGELTHWT